MKVLRGLTRCTCWWQQRTVPGDTEDEDIETIVLVAMDPQCKAPHKETDNG